MSVHRCWVVRTAAPVSSPWARDPCLARSPCWAWAAWTDAPPTSSRRDGRSKVFQNSCLLSRKKLIFFRNLAKQGSTFCRFSGKEGAQNSKVSQNSWLLSRKNYFFLKFRKKGSTFCRLPLREGRSKVSQTSESETYVPLWGEESIPGTESGIEQPSYIGWRAGTTTKCLLGSYNSHSGT